MGPRVSVNIAICNALQDAVFSYVLELSYILKSNIQDSGLESFLSHYVFYLTSLCPMVTSQGPPGKSIRGTPGVAGVPGLPGPPGAGGEAGPRLSQVSSRQSKF